MPVREPSRWTSNGRPEPDSPPASGDDARKLALIVHRGCAAENPENTVAAVEAAAPVADAIEVDVRRCDTGELVVFHDERLDRLTAATGPLDETPYDRLETLTIGDSDEPIPTLEAVFEATPPDVDLVCELKESGLVDDVLEQIGSADNDALISSFHPDVLSTVRETEPGLPTAYLVADRPVNRALRRILPHVPSWAYAHENVEDLVEKAVDLGCVAIHPRYELCLRTDLVERAHEAGLRVEAWTIDTEQEYEALDAVGVDAVIADSYVGREGGRNEETAKR